MTEEQAIANVEAQLEGRAGDQIMATVLRDAGWTYKSIAGYFGIPRSSAQYLADPSMKVRQREHISNKRKTDVQFRLACNLRSRLKDAVRCGRKSGSAVRDLGCSVVQFKEYLESLFKLGMSWENYGLHGWHMDHIRPLCSFDLTDRAQLLQACHFRNIQPLWAGENMKKGGNYEKIPGKGAY